MKVKKNKVNSEEVREVTGKCSIELANKDFTVSVDIKDCERFGLTEDAKEG